MMKNNSGGNNNSNLLPFNISQAPLKSKIVGEANSSASPNKKK
jgi:hypothetical protein